MASVTPPSGGNKPHRKQAQDVNQPGSPESKTSKEVNETAGAQGTQEQAAAGLAKSLKALLEKEFGVELGDEAFAILVDKMNAGKQLNFKTVKEAVLEAAKKLNETVSEKKLEDLEAGMAKLKPPVDPDEQPKDKGYHLTYYDPSQLFKVERWARQSLDRFMAALEDEKISRVVKEALQKSEEVKEMMLEREILEKSESTKRPRKPKDIV